MRKTFLVLLLALTSLGAALLPRREPAMAVGPTGAAAADCDAATAGIQANCTYAAGATFSIQVHVTKAPTPGGYFAYQMKVRWDAAVLDYLPNANPAAENLWPNCTIPARANNEPADPSVLFGCVPFPPLTTGKTATGAILQFQFQCLPGVNAVSPLNLVPRPGDPQNGSQLLDQVGNVLDPVVTGARVTCEGPERPARAIVFIQGIGSESSCGDTNGVPGADGFLDRAPRWLNQHLRTDPMIRAVTTVTDSVYFNYSAANYYCGGGTGENGEVPIYGPLDTCDRRILRYAEDLKGLIQRVTDKAPGTKVTIVAYSQGGLIAAYLVGRLRAGTAEERAFVRDRIASVITFESFPEGLPLWYIWSRAFVEARIILSPCGLSSPSTADWGSTSDVATYAFTACEPFEIGIHRYQVGFYTLEAGENPQIPSNLTDMKCERFHREIGLEIITIIPFIIIPGDDHTTIWDNSSTRKQDLVGCAVMLVYACEISRWGDIASIAQGETRFASAEVLAGSPHAGYSITFASTVRLTPVTPNGVRIDPLNLPAGATHNVGPNFESYEFANPEPGTWRLEVFVEQAAAGGAEVSLLLDVAPPVDSDGDGCADVREQQAKAQAQQGGRRDYLNFWDFFDTPDPAGVKDKAVDIVDIVGAVAHFGATRTPPPSKQEALAEALGPAPPGLYWTAFDRTFKGPNAWNTGPPDGAIDIFEITAAVAQFGHTCV